jgi:2,5-diamino-6-(ribosylamino)-4(3H)-pyrimidinone 5'-phosphate reductase
MHHHPAKKEMTSKPPSRPNLTFPSAFIPALRSYLPHPPPLEKRNDLPHATLTYATSLDSSLALSRSTPTVLSGPLAKALTHYLRSTHSAILIGAGTAIADDPALNCRLEGVGLEQQPRPIVVDPSGRWNVTGSRVAALAERGEGKAVWVVRGLEGGEERDEEVVGGYGGKVLRVGYSSNSSSSRTNSGKGLDWRELFVQLRREGISSVMVEGGGYVINDFWEREMHLVDSVVVTIAPVYLGEGGVVVCPRREGGQNAPVARLKQVRWIPMGEDVVVCGRP